MRRMLPLRYICSILFICFYLSFFFLKQVVVCQGFMCFFSVWRGFAGRSGAPFGELCPRHSPCPDCMLFSIISVSDLTLCVEIVTVCLPKNIWRSFVPEILERAGL